MSFLSSLVVLTAGFAWRHAHLRPAGQILVSAVESTDENLRTQAGMQLVRAGEPSATLLDSVISSGRSTEMHRRIRADLGLTTAQAIADLRTLADSDNPAVAKAARDALASMDATPDGTDAAPDRS